MTINADFVEKLLTVRVERIVSPFFAEPDVKVRPLTDAELKSRKQHCGNMTYEVMLVLDGEGDVMIGDKVYTGGAGTVFVIPPECMHDMNYDFNRCHVMHLWMIVWSDIIRYSLFRAAPGDCQFEENSNLRMFRHFDNTLYRDISELLKNVETIPLSRERRREFMALVEYRATQIVRLEREASYAETIGRPGRDILIMTQVMRYIEQQGGRDCQINVMADIFGCSRSSFIKLFRKHFGCTVLEFVDRERIRRYRGLSKFVPVKAVAAELGFGSASSFIHWRQRNLQAISDFPEHGNWKTT